MEQKRHDIYYTYLNLQSVNMKKIVILSILFAPAFTGCKNKNSNSDVGKKTETYQQVPVKNANGNIPDTSDAINLSTKKDSTSVRIDSDAQK